MKYCGIIMIIANIDFGFVDLHWSLIFFLYCKRGVGHIYTVLLFTKQNYSLNILVQECVDHMSS